MDLPDELAGTIRHQWGLVTRTQLRGAGVSDAAVRWALGRQWVVVLPGVMHIDRSPLQVSQRMLAALLYAGPGALIAGASACWWYGLRHVPSPRIVEVAVPAPATSREVQWARYRRTTVRDARSRRADPLRYVGPDRAVVTAARQCGSEQATALVIESVQRRICSLEGLGHENEVLGRRGSAAVTRAIRAAASGAWSMPELQLARIVESSRVLPAMWGNPELRTVSGQRLISPDGWFDDVAMAVMVHSRQYHDGPGFDATIEGDGELTSYGVTVVGVTPRAIESSPDLVLRRIERAYLAARSARARPMVQAEPRFAWSSQ